MMNWIKKWFQPATSAPKLTERSPLLMLAISLTKRMDTNWPEADGQFKRDNVYAQLINTFPDRSRREISRAIEEALECSD